MSGRVDKRLLKLNGNSVGYGNSPVFAVQDWERMAKDAEFRPAKMALLCSISERHLQRIFKKYLNRTPSRWLRDLQCRLAKNLISQGYSSKAAAAELKFATEAHFCREFKKAYGSSPQCYAPSHVGYLRLALLEKTVRTERKPSSRRELALLTAHASCS